MKKILCSALVAIMLLCMTACGGGVEGRYDFESMDMGGGVVITAETLSSLGGDMEMFIELKDGGTGTMSLDGEVVDMGWGDGKIWPVDDPSDTVEFEVDGSELTIEYDGVKMVFKK